MIKKINLDAGPVSELFILKASGAILSGMLKSVLATAVVNQNVREKIHNYSWENCFKKCSPPVWATNYRFCCSS